MYWYYRGMVEPEDLVSPKVYRDTIRILNDKIFEKILANKTIRLPAHMGVMRVIKKKIKIFYDERGKIRGLRINWKETKKVGHYVYHLNEHRNMYNYSFIWYKHHNRIKNLRYYVFNTNRKHSIALGQILLHQPEIDYLE